ncbi:MAG: zinc ABC transporter substrate-binding protein [Thiomicrorhabdus sp.]|nr:zinc ABC transporter substrate-binding protein [Thiomicrorhabdus sp.]
MDNHQRIFMKPRMQVLLFGLVLNVFTSSAWALTVTVSIPPLAGIIAPLLGEDDQLNVLLKTGVSPHGFQLRPSHLKAIQNSDLVVSVGSSVDYWINNSVESMSKRSIRMMDVAGVKVLPLRAAGLWTDQGHAGHQHEGHYDVHQTADGHIWLSVDNAKALVRTVSQQLQGLSPEQANVIEQRTKAWLARIAQADEEVNQLLTPVKQQPYLVLHDAFQYFEKQYQLNGVGAIRLNPDLPTSLERIHQLRERIKAGKVRCVFKEPQFSAKRLRSVTSGLSVNVGTLDPMGQFIGQKAKNASDSLQSYVYYDRFLKQMAGAFVACLSDTPKS